MKVVIFGAGEFYQKRKEKLLSYSDIERVAIIDNNKNIQGTILDGIPVLPVEQINMIEFDVILLMSAKAVEMKKQLSDLGVGLKKIWHWERLKGEKERGNFCFYCGNLHYLVTAKKVLIISTTLGYNGGTLAAVYAARALEKRQYNVVLAAPEGNSIFIDEMKNSGLNIMICSALPYLYEEEIAFVKQFDFVIVNVLQMILCASQISCIKPTLWWIHEPSLLYKPILSQFSEYALEEKLKKVDIYAVSKIAKENFNYYFPNQNMKILTYGIPDERILSIKKDGNNKIVFAIVGIITPIKAQDLFLEAISKIQPRLKNNALFWIIGLIRQDVFSNKVREMASQESNVVIRGEMTRDKLKKIYQDIDVFVCASLEETMSITTTEAMMHGKVCIVSDTTGISDYICDGINGFVFKSGEVSELIEKMNWVFNNRDKLSKIGENARQTYEKYFGMDCFGEKLEKALLQAENLSNSSNE